MSVYAVHISKGGTGKSMTAVNLSGALTLLGKKVLIIDFDSQCNTTKRLGFSEGPIYKALIRGIPPKMCDHNGIKLWPGSTELIHFEESNIEHKSLRLRVLVNQVKDLFDYIFIDCPPLAGVLARNAYLACDYVIMPVEPELSSMEGFKNMVLFREALKKDYKYSPEVSGMLINRYEPKQVLDQGIVEGIKHGNNKYYKTIIRKNTDLAKASYEEKTIFEFNWKSTGALDFMTLACELLNIKDVPEQKGTFENWVNTIKGQ